MSATAPLPLIGIYRPRDRGPGFGIPVFSNDGLMCVQDLDEQGIVRGFVPCDVDEKKLRPTNRLLQQHGAQALYSFESEDGAVIVATRLILAKTLSQLAAKLNTYPFVLYDVAEFLNDQELTIRARERCESIIRDRASTRQDLTHSMSQTSNLRAIQWEYDLVERPFCEQLKTMGWQWIEGDVDVPELTERANFREVMLRGRLSASLRKLNLRDGQAWLDDDRINRIIQELAQAPGHAVMEVNEAATKLLLTGTVTDGMDGWDSGRQQPIRFIDFEHPENNDFLVINQFKVSLSSDRGHVIPDTVLFVNGIPIVVAEFKSPSIQNPIEEAINQLLRYSNQRRELYPENYQENEGVERLFHTNQLLIASDLFEARAATIGSPPEAYLEWADTSPVPLSTVAQEVGLIPATSEVAEAAKELTESGPEESGRMGTPLFFRKLEQRPTTLQSQQVMVAGMLRPAHLLDLVRNFTVFQQMDGKTRKVVARYQQFRAIHKATKRLIEGRTRQQGASKDERGGIIWHTQGSGKSLSMIFLVRKMRMLEGLNQFKVVVVTDRTDLEGQLRDTARLSGETLRPNDDDKRARESSSKRTQRILSEPTPDIVFAMLQKYQDASKRDNAEKVSMTVVRKERKPGKDQRIEEKEITLEETIQFEDFAELNSSEKILVLVDEAHRGHTRSLHRNLRKALPNAAIIGFTGTPILSKEKGETRDIFGEWIDKYILQDAELDGATVPILYEGRTADGMVKDAEDLDELFEDMFKDYTPEELAVIKAKYATESDVLAAPLLIEKKARDMIRHFASVVLPSGYKAQVVATSREAAITYQEKLSQARDALVEQIEALPSAYDTLTDEQIDALPAATKLLIRARPILPRIKALEIGAVFSGDHNDPESWREWSDRDKQEDRIRRFKKKFGLTRTEKTDPISILVVKNMLLTGFDAPVEQVLYLDRKIVAHDLLQAIARVNRTSGKKRCGYVVDYVGVARHLHEALSDYDEEDTRGALIDISVELPKLLDRRARAVAVFTDLGITDLKAQVPACVDLLADLKTRADFINKVRAFYDQLNMLEHRPEVPGDVFRDAKLLGFINKVAANLYRDPALNLVGVGEKVKALINAHISARGIDPKIPPITITDAEFEKVLQAQTSSRARAAQMQHAARFHIIGFINQNPSFARKMSEKLEEILKRFKDDADALEKALRAFVADLRKGDSNDFPDLDPKAQVPFVRLLLDECGKGRTLDDAQTKKLIGLAIEVVERVQQEIRKIGFWKNDTMREQLTKALVRDLDKSGLCPPKKEREIAQRLVALAKENHEYLSRS